MSGKRYRSNWPYAAYIFTLLCLMGIGCGEKPDATSAAEDSANVINVGNRSEVQDLDPHLVTGIAEHRVLCALFQGLANLDATTLQPIPGAAVSWEVSPDDVAYTFKLRPEGRWSNGDPVTAHDFVYAWQRMLSPALGSEYAYLLHALKNGKAFNEGTLTDFSQVGAKAPDDLTLEVTLENPIPYFLSMQIHYAWFPVHRPTIEKFGQMTDRGTPWTRPGNHVGNGPFKLLDWKPDQVLKTVRSETYWDNANTKLDGVNFFPISNEQTEERSFRSGELDMTYSIPMHRIPVYQQESPELLVIAPYLQSYFYRFNLTRPPFNDARVRLAFSMAIDREEITRNILKGGEQPAYFLTPPGTAGYTSTYKVSHDQERARALLAEAGFPNGQGLPAIELLYNSADFDRTVAQAVQRMWKEVLGADVQLLNQDYKVYLSSMSNLDFAICRSTWLGDVLDPINFLECFLTGGGNNRTGYASPEFDALIQQAYAEADPETRRGYLQQAEARLLEDAPIAPVFFQTQKFLKSPRLQGLQPNLVGYIPWEDLYLSGDAAP